MASFFSKLKEATKLKNLTHGKLVHSCIIISGIIQWDPYILNNVMNMYAKCNQLNSAKKIFKQIATPNTVSYNTLMSAYIKSSLMQEALRIFDKIPQPDVFSFNTIMAGYIQNNESEAAIEIWFKLQILHIIPDSFTLGTILKACAESKHLQMGKQIHCYGLKSCAFNDTHVARSLMVMYCKNGCLNYARQVFDQRPSSDVFDYNVMISGHASVGDYERVLQFYHDMQANGIVPNEFTFPSLLSVCGNSKGTAEEEGEKIHDHVKKLGLDSDFIIGCALVDMYAKSDFLEKARGLFEKMRKRNWACWTAIISGYIQNGEIEEGLKLFVEMIKDGTRPNEFTLSSAASACASGGHVFAGMQVHNYAIKVGYEMNSHVGNSILHMYCSCGDFISAKKVFDLIPKSTVTWNGMISGLVHNGCYEESLLVFKEMRIQNIEVDEVTLTCLLNSCAGFVQLMLGCTIHGYLVKLGMGNDVYVGSALLDMYAKCGSLDKAIGVFSSTYWGKSEVPWNSLISGYAQHGHASEAVELLERMKCEDIFPNTITFISLISACSHAGLVQEGRKLFISMKEDYGILPTMDHYACMVDLLGRGGELVEAMELVKRMPFQPGILVWQTLLAACRTYKNWELGLEVARYVLELRPRDPSAYVLLYNVYAGAGRWDDAEKVRMLLDDQGLKKEAGYSWIMFRNQAHTFVARDTSHPQATEIFAKLDELTKLIKLAGYAPDVDSVLYDVEDQQKEESVRYHSERLAISFGLINIPMEMPLVVFKNLRVCCDCHNATKFISEVTKRELVVRDASRFHHFKDGKCSCGDFW